MNNWTNYLLQANLYLVLFYGFYWLILRRETFFQSNRFYLLSALLIALLIPLIPLPNLIAQTEIGQNLQEYNPLPIQVKLAEEVQKPSNTKPDFNLWEYVPLFYYLIISILAIRFLFSLFLIFRLAFSYAITRKGRIFWVNLPDNQPTFSFLKILFWGNAQTLTEAEQKQVLQHELVHIRQLHSVDILVVEVLKIIFWYNPFLWLYQKSLRQIHEYLADRATIRQGADQTEYANLLLSQALLKDKLRLGNSFNHITYLKSRIMKINQTPSTKSARLRFVGIIPVVFVCLLVASCARERVVELEPKNGKVQIPAGYTELKTWQVNANSPKEFKYIFSKNTDYSIQILTEAGKIINPNEIILKLYEMKDEQTIERFITSNNGKAKINFRAEKTAVYMLEMNLQKPDTEFLINLSFQKSNQLEQPIIDKQNPENRESANALIEGFKKEMSILLEKTGTQKLKFEIGKNYLFTFGDVNQKMLDINNLENIVISLYNLDGKKIASNFANNKHYPAMAYACQKTGEFELRYEVKKPDPNYFLLISSK